jgi:hypothetical protein
MNKPKLHKTAFEHDRIDEVRRLYRAGRARGLRALDILARIYRADLPTVKARRWNDTLRRVGGYDDCVQRPPLPILLAHPPADDVRVPLEFTIGVSDGLNAASVANAIRAALTRHVLSQTREALRTVIRS